MHFKKMALTASVLCSLGMFMSVGSAQTLAANETIIPTKTYSGKNFPVYYRKALPVTAARVRYTGFHPETTILKAGTVRFEGAMPLPTDILLERDKAVKLRDGTTIYADVFRPVDQAKHPAILCISPYGKEVGGQALDDVPGRAGVPKSATSGLERFEGADPAYWVSKGYAVINPDPRGAYSSEGNINYWGRQYAEDGYDIVEWIAKQDWSNEKVGMAGNSWLTVSQWFIAAEQPPHLAAIAPWEGFSDHFRESGTRGGIPNPAFPEKIAETFASAHGLLEDQPRMIVEYPFLNEYWQDKQARLSRIKIPAYVVASYTNPVHTHGTFAGFREISSKDKWLRVHLTQEWNDFYNPTNVADLTKFFDHYLKGEDNGWEKTPKVRLSVYELEGHDVINRSEQEFPLARTQYKKMYLDAKTDTLQLQKPQAAELSYDSESAKPEAVFTYKFDKDTELTGYMKLHLWAAAADNDDMDLSVKVEKLAADGTLLNHNNFSDVIATGLLCASCRALDPKKSTESEPYLTGTSEQKLQKGQIVPLEIGLWPMGMVYHKGETLRLTVGAYQNEPADLNFGRAKIDVPVDSYTYPAGTKVKKETLGGNSTETADPAQVVTAPATHNKGRHILYTGGEHDSYLLVPVVPEKHKAAK